MKQKFGMDLAMEDSLEHLYRVYMHFDFDDYNADKMDDMRAQSLGMKGIYKMSRMVPQGLFHYFFTYDTKQPPNPNRDLDADEPEPVYKKYTFTDDYQVKVFINEDVQWEILQKLGKPNRYAFNVENFDLDHINQINTILVKD